MWLVTRPGELRLTYLPQGNQGWEAGYFGLKAEKVGERLPNINMYMSKYITIFFILLAQVLHAEPIDSYISDNLTIEVNEDSNGVVYIRLDGMFSEDLPFAMTSFITLYSPKYIELNSDGGYMDTIEPVGSMISSNDIFIRINSGDMCVSACAFLALYSKNIIINGQLAFHIPYSMNYDGRMSLNEIANTSVADTVIQAKTFFNNGWILYFYFLIGILTDRDTYIVFTDSSELNKLRTTDIKSWANDMPEVSFLVMSAASLKEWQYT